MNFSDCQKYNKLRIICVVMILLVLTMPFSYAQEVRGTVDETVEEPQERNIGEDILINVDEYQPRIIRSGLLSKQNINVYALLRGTPINPSIKIARIKSIDAKIVNITTKPEGKKINFASLAYRAPRREEISYDNMGYIIVPLRKMKEDEMPDEIKIAVNARIFFDISEALLYSRYVDVLPEQTEDEWLTGNQHQFFGGYVRADEVKDDRATFFFYDVDKNKISSFSLKPGDVKRVNSYARLDRTLRGTGYSGLFDNFRIKLDSITGIGVKAKLLIFKENQFSTVTLSKGSTLYDGSSWYVDDIKEKEDEFEVVLRSARFGSKSLFLKRRDCSKYDNKEKECKNAGCEFITDNRRCVKKITEEDGADQKTENGKATEFNGIVNDYDKKRKETEPNYDDITNRFKNFLEKNPTYKGEAINYLYKIKKYYTDKLEESIDKKAELSKDIEKNKDEIDKINNQITNLEKKIQEIHDIIFPEIKGGEIVTAEKDENAYYRKAINAYERVISDYGDDTPKILELKRTAKERIAIINLFLKDYSSSLAGFKKLAELPETSASKKGFYIDMINTLNRLLNYQETKPESLREDGEEIRVQLLGAEGITSENRPKAYLRIDSGEIKSYGEGDYLPIVGWKVLSITERNRITLKNDDSRIRDVILRVNAQEELKDADGKITNKVELTNIDLKLEAHITITPQVEEAMTEANFNLYLTIEKRPKLENFVGNLDNTIKKTEKLIEKLDKIINNVEKIHNIWTKSCYVTFGTLWVKNLITGFMGSTGVARKKITGKWHDKYEREGKGMNYDQFIIKNREAYEKDLKNAESILKDIREKKHISEVDGLGLDKLSNEDKADFYWKWKMFDKDSSNSQEYINARLNAIERNVDSEVAKIEKFGDIPKEDLDEIKKYEIIKDLNAENFKDEKKTQALRIYKIEKSKQERDSFFNDDKLYSSLDSENQKRVKQDIELAKSKYIDKPPIKEIDINFIKNDKNQDNGIYFVDSNTGNARKIELLNGNTNIVKGAKIKFVDNNEEATIAEKTEKEYTHISKLTQIAEGRNKGKIDMISINSLYYAQVEYAASGLPSKTYIWKRGLNNEALGTSNSDFLGEINEVQTRLYEKRKAEGLDEEEKELLKEIGKLSTKIQNCNRKLEFRTWRIGSQVGTECEGYSVSEKAPIPTGPQCTDFMTPTDCGILFNACDPVICPTSRCNLGGRWTVKNVVETGIAGSTILCLPNFGMPPEKVLMPICITGILAGLKNIQSILKGFKECLVAAKVKGESIGICDRIRNFYICDILWREAMAILNLKGGLLGLLTDKIAGKAEGGAEYSNFKQSLDNSVGSVSYFTQSYAKNVFIAYSGKGLGEIGTEICKSAIYGNVPGIGDFFEQALKPESPPQFFALLDEVPYQNVLERRESIYTVFYHIYAGENEDIIYSVYLQSVDETGNIIQPFGRVYVVPNKRLDQGQFVDENIEKVLFSGYNQICVEISTSLKGRRTECGFGKVTTEYGINWLNDMFTAKEAARKINTREECVSETGRITNLEWGSQSSLGLATIPEAAVGAYSTGLVSTGIVRTCSAYDPDVGTGKDEWKPVGTCGVDERERNLGQCWLYAPALNELIKDSERRNDITGNLDKRAAELVKNKEEYMGCNFNSLMKKADELKNKQDSTEQDLLTAIETYTMMFDCGFPDNINIQAQFDIGEAYEGLAELKGS